MSRRRRQKGKSRKRLRSWHRGSAEESRWLRRQEALPTVDPGVDYTSAGPQPFPRNHPPRRGDVV